MDHEFVFPAQQETLIDLRRRCRACGRRYTWTMLVGDDDPSGIGETADRMAVELKQRVAACKHGAEPDEETEG